MCDYSLQHIASRPAKVGDKLETSAFTNTISKGFCESGVKDVAVCVLPGTEIAFDAPIQHSVWTNLLGVTTETCQSSVGIFRQVDSEQPYTHHDALELPDGTIIKLNNLVVGQRATVLQLPAAPKNEQEVKDQTRLEIVG